MWNLLASLEFGIYAIIIAPFIIVAALILIVGVPVSLFMACVEVWDDISTKLYYKKKASN